MEDDSQECTSTIQSPVNPKHSYSFLYCTGAFLGVILHDNSLLTSCETSLYTVHAHAHGCCCFLHMHVQYTLHVHTARHCTVIIDHLWHKTHYYDNRILPTCAHWFNSLNSTPWTANTYLSVKVLVIFHPTFAAHSYVHDPPSWIDFENVQFFKQLKVTFYSSESETAHFVVCCKVNFTQFARECAFIRNIVYDMDIFCYTIERSKLLFERYWPNRHFTHNWVRKNATFVRNTITQHFLTLLF